MNTPEFNSFCHNKILYEPPECPPPPPLSLSHMFNKLGGPKHSAAEHIILRVHILHYNTGSSSWYAQSVTGGV